MDIPDNDTNVKKKMSENEFILQKKSTSHTV